MFFLTQFLLDSFAYAIDPDEFISTAQKSMATMYSFIFDIRRYCLHPTDLIVFGDTERGVGGGMVEWEMGGRGGGR